MSQLLIIGITGLVAFLVFDSIRESEELNYYLIPVILLALFAFFISWAFFSVYDMAVDTLFLCFCELIHVFIVDVFSSCVVIDHPS
jgi:hypothetical protein